MPGPANSCCARGGTAAHGLFKAPATRCSGTAASFRRRSRSRGSKTASSAASKAWSERRAMRRARLMRSCQGKRILSLRIPGKLARSRQLCSPANPRPRNRAGRHPARHRLLRVRVIRVARTSPPASVVSFKRHATVHQCSKLDPDNQGIMQKV